MSVVTSYVLFTHDEDYCTVEILNARIQDHRFLPSGKPRPFDKFNDPTDSKYDIDIIGGSKVASSFWAAGMNHFPIGEMVTYIHDTDWQRPNGILLMWKGVGGEQWNIMPSHIIFGTEEANGQ